MNQSTQTHFTIKTQGNKSTKDELLEKGAVLLRIIGKNRGQRYSMVTDIIALIPNDAHIIVRRTQWGSVVHNFSEILRPVEICDGYNADGEWDFHYEIIKSDLVPVSGKIFKKVVLNKRANP